MSDQALAAPLRRMAGETWALRALGERAAEARFARLAEALGAAGTSAPVLELANRAASDEARHFGFCVDAAARFDVAVPDESVAIPWTATGMSDDQRLLHEVVAMCCITETLSAAFLVEMQRQTTDPELHATVREILADEVGHSRIGWGHLAHVYGRIDLRYLGACLPGMLSDTVGDVLFASSSPNDPALALGPYGVLARTTRREIFTACMRQVVFPGLTQHGVDCAAGIQWLDTRSSRSGTTP